MWTGLGDTPAQVTLICPALQSKGLSSTLQGPAHLVLRSSKRRRMGNATSPRGIQVKTLQNREAIGLHTSINQSS